MSEMCGEAAEYTALELKRIGMENVRLLETTTTERKGHPVVYAEWLHATLGADGKPKPTVLSKKGASTAIVDQPILLLKTIDRCIFASR
jgi:hypothetical protein